MVSKSETSANLKGSFALAPLHIQSTNSAPRISFHISKHNFQMVTMYVSYLISNVLLVATYTRSLSISV